MKINTFKKQIEKINTQNIVDQYIAFNAMKRLLDIQIKGLKEEILKTKNPSFNITHIKKTWVEGYYKKAHKRISIKK
jgi:predicted transport protein